MKTLRFTKNFDAPGKGAMSTRYMAGGVYEVPDDVAVKAIKAGAAGDVVPVVDVASDPAPAKGKPNAKPADKTGDKTGAPTP